MLKRIIKEIIYMDKRINGLSNKKGKWKKLI